MKVNDIQKMKLAWTRHQYYSFYGRQEDSYSIVYKRHFSKSALRFGLNYNYSSEDDATNDFGFRTGFEWKKTYSKSQLFYGVDFSFNQLSYPERSIKVNRYGSSFLIGFRYQIGKRFSVSVEPKINAYYFKTTNHDTFSPTSTTSHYAIRLGSTGLILLNFHF